MEERDIAPSSPSLDPDATPDPDTVAAQDDPSLTEYDKTIADSFPASDPPAQP